ncbi:MAG: hypothetical protein AAF292_11020 [Pseudomonadota bacterium]
MNETWGLITPTWNGEFVRKGEVKINWRDWEITTPSIMQREFLVAPLIETDPRHNHVHMKDIVRFSASRYGGHEGKGFTDEGAAVEIVGASRYMKVAIDRVICSIKVNGDHTTSRTSVAKQIASATGGEVIIEKSGQSPEALGFTANHPAVIANDRYWDDYWNDFK